MSPLYLDGLASHCPASLDSTSVGHALALLSLISSQLGGDGFCPQNCILQVFHESVILIVPCEACGRGSQCLEVLSTSGSIVSFVVSFTLAYYSLLH